MIGKHIRLVFYFLKDRIWQKIKSWRAKPIFKGGREILVKAVVQAIPIYCKNGFLLPDEIQRMINSF